MTIFRRAVFGLILLGGVSSPGVILGQTSGPTLEQRVGRLERIMENQLNLYLQMQALQKEVDSLRGEQEVLQHRLDQLDKSQRDLYLDIDNRLRQLEAAMEQLLAPPSPANPAPPLDGGEVAPPETPAVSQPGEAASTGMVPAPVSPVAGASSADAGAYEQAFSLLREGRYDEAIAAFQAYLQRFPDGRYAANAQYWLGEAFYVKRDFPRAIQEFSQVLARFPDSNKVPDAMLKLGFSHYELKQWDQARKILEQLIQQYPDATAARLAKRRLRQMKLEGHG